MGLGAGSRERTQAEAMVSATGQRQERIWHMQGIEKLRIVRS